MKWIYGTGIIICLLTIALFWQLGQALDMNARLVGEMKQMQVQINTHEARINGLADEQAWVREKVRISVEVGK
jgi:hypothetical protein